MKRILAFLPAAFLSSVILFTSQDLMSQASSSGNNATHPATPQSRPPQPVPSTGKKKPGRVWTNEDVGGLTGNVSVVGNPANPAPSTKVDKIEEPPQKSGDELKDAAWYRKQLAPLRAQVDSIDRDIQKLKNFKGSNAAPEGGIRYGGRYNMTPLQQQVTQLEARRKSLESNIEEIEREARHHGIEPSELR